MDFETVPVGTAELLKELYRVVRRTMHEYRMFNGVLSEDMLYEIDAVLTFGAAWPDNLDKLERDLTAK